MRDQIETLRNQLDSAPKQADHASLVEANSRLTRKLRDSETLRQSLEQDRLSLRDENEKLKSGGASVRGAEPSPDVGELIRRAKIAEIDRAECEAKFRQAEFRITDLERRLYAPPAP